MTKKMYEISNDPETDKHILLPVGFAGLTEKELQAMEDQVRKANELRRQEQNFVGRITQEENDRLRALEQKDPPYKAQLEKYKNGKLGEPQAEAIEKMSKQKRGEPVGGRGGCTSCAKKGLMGLIRGGAKLLKAELGVDAADEATMETRKALCLKCPIYDFGVCVEEKGGCGCILYAKIKVRGESCPLPNPKWEAVK